MLRIIIAGLLLLIRQTDGWSPVTSRVVHEGPPESEIFELAEIYDTQDVYRLNDHEVGLTALKDKKLKSCFVNDLDPLWFPADSDKRYIITSQPCEKVNKNTDLPTLRKKAGPKIASMCRDLYVFWLAARNMEPPLLPRMYQQESRHCEFDVDVLIADPLMAPTDDGSSHIGSGLQPFPDTHEVAPPMLLTGPHTNSKEGSPPELPEKAPPMIEDGAPPKFDDGAPPMLRNNAQPMPLDGAPPMIGDGAPPMIGDSAPPMIGDSAPPMLQGRASQTLQGGAPPMLRENAAPMSRDGPPPMMNVDGPPPMLKDGESAPPLSINSHSRRDLDVPLVPPMVKTQVTEKKPATLADMFKKMKENRALYPVPTPDMNTPPAPKFRRYM